MDMGAEGHWFRYTFTFPDGTERKFSVTLDETYRIANVERESWPEWTQLDKNKCPNCPLDSKTVPRCPVAEHLVDVIDFFKNALSVEVVDVKIEVPARTYVRKQVPLSQGVSGLIGIIMPTSGCPILGRLKPMVGTHLPFASLQETAYRMLSMYLMGQYFRMRRGSEPDWEFKELIELFDGIRIVNKSFCKRLHLVCEQDASLNAVVRLDCFADNSSFLIQRKGLDKIEGTFDEFFKKNA